MKLRARYNAFKNNLKKYTFEYLNNFDLIHLFYTDKQTQNLIALTGNIIKIFFFIFSLELQYTKKGYLNQFDGITDLFTKIYEKFEEFGTEAINNGIVFFLNYYNQIYKLNKIAIDTFDEKEFNIILQIVEKLDKEKFVYFFYNFGNTSKMENEASLLKKIKYVSIENLKKKQNFIRLLCMVNST